MKTILTEYNDDGKIIRQVKINYSITWGEDNPSIEVSLPDKSKTRHLCINISLQQFLSLFNKQVDSKRIKKLRERL